MTKPSPTSSRSRSISSDGPTGAHWGSLAWRTLRVLCKGAAASLSARPKLRGLKVFPAILDSRVSAACSLLSTPCRAVGVGAVRHHRDLCCCHTWLYSDESRQQDASSRTPPLDASWERGRPFRLRSHAASSSARTCDAVPTFGSPQVCGPRGRIPPTLTRSSERLGHGFSPRFCRCAPKAREASKGGARQAAPVGRGGRGMWVPGSQVSRPSGPLAAGMKSVRPCSRHRLAPRPLRPTHTGHAAHLALFSNSCRSAVAQPHQATSCASPAVGTRNVVESTRRVSLSPSHLREVCCAGLLCAVSRTTPPRFQGYVCTPLARVA